MTIPRKTDRHSENRIPCKTRFFAVTRGISGILTMEAPASSLYRRIIQETKTNSNAGQGALSAACIAVFLCCPAWNSNYIYLGICGYSHHAVDTQALAFLALANCHAAG